MSFIPPIFAKTACVLGNTLAALLLSTVITNAAVAVDIPALYDNSCAVCHDSGALNAPKKGDKAAWDKVKKKGMPTLIKAVKSGMIQMPAGGLCDDCKAEDYQKLIEYMSQ